MPHLSNSRNSNQGKRGGNNLYSCKACGIELKRGARRLPVNIYGAPWGIRTHDLEIRSLLLYPTELRALIQ